MSSEENYTWRQGFSEGYGQGFRDGLVQARQQQPAAQHTRTSSRPTTYEEGKRRMTGQLRAVMELIVNGADTRDLLRESAATVGVGGKSWSPRVADIARMGWIESSREPYVPTAAGLAELRRVQSGGEP